MIPRTGTLLCTTELTGRIFGTRMLLSPEPWIFQGKLSPDPDLTEVPETGYPELVLVQILLRLT